MKSFLGFFVMKPVSIRLEDKNRCLIKNRCYEKTALLYRIVNLSVSG